MAPKRKPGSPIERKRMSERARAQAVRDRRNAAGLCYMCGEVPVTPKPGDKGAMCDGCKEARQIARAANREEREPMARRFEIALNHVRKGRAPRDALGVAGILGPLLRGEI